MDNFFSLVSNTLPKTKRGVQLGTPEVLNDGGGQGVVYKVPYKGATKVLKLYRRVYAGDEKMWENLVENAKAKSPDPHFVWPIDLIENVEVEDEKGRFPTFGYVMDLFPEGYLSANTIYNNVGEVKLEDLYILCSALLRICTAFKRLHIRGLCYQDISCNNVVIEPKTGDVRIGDTDNIAPENTAGFVFVNGTLTFTAPEIFRDQENRNRTHFANISTDEYSLAVLLFMLLFRAHPLQGQRFHRHPAMINDVFRYEYGLKPTYIFDHLLHMEDYGPGSARLKDYNGPDESEKFHPLIFMHYKAPKYLLDAFARSFSRGSLEGDKNAIDNRTHDFEWEKIFLRMQAQCRVCRRCGEQVFEKDTGKCPCGEPFQKVPRIRLGGDRDYTVPLEPRRMLARAQFGFSDRDAAAAPLIWVGGSGNKITLQNISGTELKASFRGESRAFPANAALYAAIGLSISSDNGMIEIIEA